MNYFKYLILFMLISLISVYKVHAYASCTYSDVENDSIKFTALIYEEGEDISSEVEIDRTNVLYGNNQTYIGNAYNIYPENFLTGDYDQAYDYYKNEGCPPNFYVTTDITLNTYVGYFSNINVKDLEFEPLYHYVNSSDSKVEITEEGVTPVAEKYACEYSAIVTGKEFKTTLTINKTDKVFYFSNGDFVSEKDYIKNFTFTDENPCPDDLYTCLTSLGSDTFFIRSEKEIEDTVETCGYLVDTGTGKNVEIGNNGCTFFADSYQNYIRMVKDEKNYDELKKISTQVKDFCSNVFKYSDYDNYVSSCPYLCLNNIFYFDNYNSPKNDQCGLSEKLISFIMNIIKWVKYIVPVAVIILGIIDFLRAIGSEKDDGLKKAQGRFIRRIIAAALIFIIPFILEFIIEKMGFISDTCGII